MGLHARWLIDVMEGAFRLALGYVDDRGSVEGEVHPLATIADHMHGGDHLFRWRYREDTQSVYWWNIDQVSVGTKDRVDQWLRRKGFGVLHHKDQSRYFERT